MPWHPKQAVRRSTPTGFFAGLVRCGTRLYNALNDRLREQHGIVTSQFGALRYLRDHPESRVADLAAEFAIGIGIGATGKTIERLEKQGRAVRQPWSEHMIRRRPPSRTAVTDTSDHVQQPVPGTLSEIKSLFPNMKQDRPWPSPGPMGSERSGSVRFSQR